MSLIVYAMIVGVVQSATFVSAKRLQTPKHFGTIGVNYINVDQTAAEEKKSGKLKGKKRKEKKGKKCTTVERTRRAKLEVVVQTTSGESQLQKDGTI